MGQNVGAASRVGRLRGVLLRPSSFIEKEDERHSARLLAMLSLIFLGLVGVFALMQSLLMPGFKHALSIMLVLMPMNLLAYGLARTRRWRLGALVISLLPLVACFSVAVLNPDDPAWFAFLFMGPLFASVWLSFRAVLVILVVDLAGIVLLGLAHPAYAEVARWMPYLSFHVVAGLLVLARRWDGAREELLRQEAIRTRERRLAQVQRLETVGQMAAGVAHDLNTLLAVVSAATEVADRKPEQASRSHETVLEAVDRGAQIVHGMLAFARSRPARLVALKLSEELEGCRTLLQEIAGRAATVVCEVEEDLPVITIDQGRFEQVLFNLVSNASQAMPEGGEIRIRAARRHAAQAHPGAGQGAPGQGSPFAVLSVEDDGPGIDPETRAHLFDPFYTTRPEGTGLGLATAHGIVRDAGGRILVESEPGKGARFEVWFPASVS